MPRRKQMEERYLGKGGRLGKIIHWFHYSTDNGKKITTVGCWWFMPIKPSYLGG
jgi:hypothetical protein